jgi:hypothetical protein
MDHIRQRLESELDRTMDRIRYSTGNILLEEVTGAVGSNGFLADGGDIIRRNADREMSFATRSLLVERPEARPGARASARRRLRALRGVRRADRAGPAPCHAGSDDVRALSGHARALAAVRARPGGRRSRRDGRRGTGELGRRRPGSDQSTLRNFWSDRILRGGVSCCPRLVYETSPT